MTRIIEVVGALMLTMVCVASAGATTGSMTVSVDDMTANTGDIIYVPINVSGASSVGAVDISLMYDSDVICPTGLINAGDLTDGVLLINENTIYIDPDTGKENISEANNQTIWDYGALANYTGTSGVVNISIICNCEEPPVGFNGVGSVTTVQFEVIGSGGAESPLGLVVSAYNVSAPIVNTTTGNTTGYDEISVTTENGTLTAGTGTTGDINGDTNVNIDDLILLGQAWGTYPGDSGYNAAADINNDGEIDIDDLILLGQNWTG